VINASVSNGLTLTSDLSGQLQFQNNGINLPMGGVAPAFSASASGAQTGISSGVNVKILFQTEAFDTNSNFASSRFTPTVAGYYQINSAVQFIIGSSAGSTNFLSIWKNGSEYSRGIRMYQAAPSITMGLVACSVVYCNGSTDYIEIYAFSSGGTWATEGALSYFQACLVRGE
jgi:hypothetical protein